QNNDLTGNTEAAIRVENGGKADAGDCSNSNFTGLGSSTGGNNLSYGFLDAAPWAIEDLNAAGDNVLADQNNFGAAAGANIGAAIYHSSDLGTLSTVLYSQNPEVIPCPAAPGPFSCGAAVDAPYANFAQFSAAGGTFSANHDQVLTWGGDVISGQTCPNRYTITRTYNVSDSCGN